MVTDVNKHFVQIKFRECIPWILKVDLDVLKRRSLLEHVILNELFVLVGISYGGVVEIVAIVLVFSSEARAATMKIQPNFDFFSVTIINCNKGTEY